ncbi:MAG: bifunctional diaminohydroxyphosphoribosylaminopyrimidine deaminase/5-amino-6-(5-phosphoribosylamino)uracil reductase RibD [Chitinivibrionales bacterium]|nr:bifunctional diaminohydroxyphosphoribosylaminopyrimidine deaminase/5-amino-6-(5-phosphoribosylamino)uracil reductase RibD [Chitinivibrionales bacterium]MBD3358534.1 bifunctional diaminohydroxyphosphoribosylaminopyrimidine deaminase/5-amino-6-(5-phosphoribosylamino)uracil reductase RibD [Chitinivibrionales bacterium]
MQTRPFTDRDKRYMKRALERARAVKGTTFPNPAVGAIVVRGGRLVGEGATRPPGKEHAEIVALSAAGSRTVGATLYVTLEPCSHFGRTPPCCRAIAESGVAEVIVAAKDPNPRVNGRGIRYLRGRGIKVSVGLLREEAVALNEDYAWSAVSGRAWVTLKLATTLDGRIADKASRSKWITSQSSRAVVHDLRRRHAAVVIGAGTLRLDNPRLSVRHVMGRSPARIVFASDPEEGYGSRLRRGAKSTRTVFVCPGGKAGTITKADDDVELWRTGSLRTPANLKLFLEMAHREGMTSLLVEGGQKLASSFLAHRLVNRICWFYGGILLGGGLNAIEMGSKALSLRKAVRLTDLAVERMADDIMVSGVPVWS